MLLTRSIAEAALKAHFDALLGHSVYDLLPGVAENSLR